MDFFLKPSQSLPDTLPDLGKAARAEYNEDNQKNDNELREPHCPKHP